MTERPNIIWITLDSVRSDHTTMGGYERDTTPELERISKTTDGQWFSNCFSHNNSTRTSTASIITGTYPSHHGVTWDKIIPPELETVPEIFSKVGYHTVGISRNANSSMGFNRGFDEFKWISSSQFLSAVDLPTVIKYGLNVRKHSAGFTTDTAKHATPFIINDMAKRRIRSYVGDSEPFFMYLHYNEPHRPYYPPLSYLDEYTDEIEMSTQEAAEVAMEMHRNANEIIANGSEFSEEEWEALYAMYDAEIAYTDDCVGRLFDYVKSLNIDNTIFVITADHGELFGEKDMLTHKIVLHDAVINVPLVTHGFGKLETGTDDLVQHADIMQTLVAMAGGDTSQFQGVDIREESRNFVVAQDQDIGKSLDKFAEYNPEFNSSRYHRSLLTCIRDQNYKYQKSEENAELFILPDEEEDISDEEPEVVEDMDTILDKWVDEYGYPVSEEEKKSKFSDKMKQQLSDLGYIVD
ncbi:sulfatase-like hydrolase/transferase [Halonotius sp. F2-221B]|uniref:sulfatase n=1 Tax=Halonotius sp. F2-221B TaxID=2731620 RepID=UPI00398B2EF5